MITPLAGWKVDPNNPGGVVRDVPQENPVPTPTPAASTGGLYRYQLASGQEATYGDPTINKDVLAGAKFLGQQGNPSATDPLAGAAGIGAPVTRYTTPGGVAGSEAGAMFQPGGAFGNTKPYSATEEQAIRDAETARMKASIDAITSSYLKERKAAEVVATNRLGRSRALAASTGTLGAPMGDTAESEVAQFNLEEMQAIEDKKNAAIEAIKTKTEDRARTLIEARKTEAGTSAEKYLSYLSGVATQAKDDFKNLAMAGTDYETMSKKDPQGLQKLIEQSGMTEQGVRALFIANSPQGTYINKDKPNISADGKTATFFKQVRDPATGKLSITSENVDIPVGMDPKNTEIISRDDGLYAVNKVPSADGSYSMKKIGEGKSAALVRAEAYAKSVSGQGGGVGGEQLYSGLKPATATAIRGRVSTFKSEPIVTNFNTINEGYDTVKSIADNSKNPSDHQALVYAFAKIMDPNSVVREGEYATVQKYAQSWVKAYGKGMEQAILGTGFLSEDAIKNMKDTLEKKFQSSKKNYDNVYKQYEKGINELSGRKDGAKFLTDYAAAFQDKTGGEQGGGSDLQSRADAGGYDYEAMKAAGISDEDIDASLSADGL